MWTAEDVEKHKKGLTEKGKKQWMRIANSVRSKLMKKGMSEEEADASAIKQANGVVNTNAKNEQYSVYKNKPVIDYETRLVVHQTKPYLVVPVVMMVEGVHHGNMGPLLHRMEELGKFSASWNGIPVVINHPEEDKQQVSANVPAIIDNVAVGRVYNTEVDGSKLRAEVWLDEDKLNEVSPGTLEDINNNKAIEVSIGAFTENYDEDGMYGGKKYVGIATNHRPDHLAILPDAVGACSCEDGCGIGANKGIEDKQKTELVSGKLESKETVKSTLDRTEISINNKNEKGMAEECKPCIKKKVDELIVNSQGKWTEDDRVMLETLSEPMLDKIAKPVEVTKEVEKKVEVQVNVLSKEDQEALATYKKEKKEKRELVIKNIQANSSVDMWPNETLNAMSDDTLKRLFDSVKKEDTVDYSLMGEGRRVQANASAEDLLLPTGMELETNKK